MSTSASVPGLARWPGADRPSAYIPGDRRRALTTGTTLPTRVHGAALFADISGFTPLTEALANELGSQRASEVLTGHLNRVFHAVIAELDRFGGDVIYFSGDAITCWLDGDDGSRATAAGFAMQEAMRREGEITTPGGLSLPARAQGRGRGRDRRGRFVVGDPEIQLIDVLAGSLVDLHRRERAPRREGRGRPARVGASLRSNGHVALGETRTSAGAGVGQRDRAASRRGRRGDRRPRRTPELPGRARAPVAAAGGLRDACPAATASSWPSSVRPTRSSSASAASTTTPTTRRREKLDDFVRATQRILASYGGNVLS